MQPGVNSQGGRTMTATAQTGMAGVLHLVESFNGENGGKTVKAFFKELEGAALLGKWGDAEKAEILKLKIKGEALNFFEARPDLQAATYAVLKQALIERFKECELYASQNFFQTLQKPSETIREYETRLRQAGQKTLKETDNTEERSWRQKALEENLLHQFLKGLNANIKRFVMSKNPTTFSQAIQVALLEEQNEVLTKNFRHVVHAVRDAGADNDTTYKGTRSTYLTGESTHNSGVTKQPYFVKRHPESRERNNQGNLTKSNEYVNKEFARSVNKEAAGFVPRQNIFQNVTSRRATQGSGNYCALTYEKQKGFEGRCYTCNKTGHYARDCRSHTNDNAYEVVCYNCNRPGHLIRDCRFPKDKRQPNYKRNNTSVRKYPN